MSPPDVSYSDEENPSSTTTALPKDDENADTKDIDKPDLTYVDIIHDTKQAANDCNGYENITDSQHQSVLYSTIKLEIPAPISLLETETKYEAKLLDIDDPTVAQNVRESSFIPVTDNYDLGDDDLAEKPLPALPIEVKLNTVIEDKNELEEEEYCENKIVPTPDPMTVEEADILLSSR